MELITHRNIQDDSGVDAKLFVRIMETFEWAIGKIPDQLTGRLIVEMQADGASEPHSILDISPPAGEGDNCAEGKIMTLRKYPAITNTGELTLLPDNARDKDDIEWYGGIQIRYTDTNMNNGEVVKGVLRVAFSGAKEWHDVFVAVAVLHEAIKCVVNLCPDYRFSYDYGKLRDDVVSGFFCNLFGA